MYSCEEISIIEKYQYFIRLCFTTININIKKKRKKNTKILCQVLLDDILYVQKIFLLCDYI